MLYQKKKVYEIVKFSPLMFKKPILNRKFFRSKNKTMKNHYSIIEFTVNKEN